MMADSQIQKAIDSIKKVLNIHENHLYPVDEINLQNALESLEKLKADGFL